MYVIKKMMVNKLQPKPVVTNKAMFVASGARPCNVESKDTADCANDPVPYGARKTQLIALGQAMAKVALAKQESNGASPSMTPVSPREM